MFTTPTPIHQINKQNYHHNLLKRCTFHQTQYHCCIRYTTPYYTRYPLHLLQFYNTSTSMNLPLRQQRQQTPQFNPKNNNNNEELPTRRRISARLMMIICKYCKYPTIAILFSVFLYSFVAIGIYLGEAISEYSGLTSFDSDKNNMKLESKIVSTDSSVIFGVFYIPIENNAKHPLNYYHTGLQKTCSFLRGLGHPAIALGDPDKLRSVPGCGWLTEVEGGTYRIKDLRYINESSIPIRHGCYIKFTKSPPNDKPLLQKDTLQIWLNKIHVLADLADSYQDKLVVLVDAGLPPYLFPKVKKIVDEGLKVNNLNDQSLGARMYSKEIIDHKTWFGKEQCTTPPKVSACILAIRGRAGNHMRAIFEKKVSETAMLAEKNDTCPCYDEEIILSSIYDDDMSLLN